MHVLNWPFKHLHLDGLAGRVKYAQLLNDASEVHLVQLHPHQSQLAALPEDTLILQLPVNQPDAVVPVIELFLE